MSTSTDGKICFGVCFEEDYEFPWGIESDEEIETWWRKENNYVPPFEPWTDDGRAEGVTDENINEYFAHRREWDKCNPIPVVEVNYCSGDYPMIILATPSSSMSASRGYPVEFEPNKLVVDEQEEQALKDFCEKYELENTGAKWWLSSYWG